MAKKTFKQEKTPAAMAFISPVQEQQPETKSKRVQLLLKPSVWEDLQKIAHMERRSLNDLINRIGEQYAEREAKKVEQYNEIYGKELHK